MHRHASPTLLRRFTGVQAMLGAWSVALALLSAGWIVLPAKDSELKAVATQVASLRVNFQAFTEELRELRRDVQSSREEVIRLSASGAPPAANAPVPTARKRRAGAPINGFQARLEAR